MKNGLPEGHGHGLRAVSSGVVGTEVCYDL